MTTVGAAGCSGDAFSAMTTDRSYRAALSEDAALAETIRCSGTQFAPEVVDALVRVLGAGRVGRPAERGR